MIKMHMLLLKSTVVLKWFTNKKAHFKNAKFAKEQKLIYRMIIRKMNLRAESLKKPQSKHKVELKMQQTTRGFGTFPKSHKGRQHPAPCWEMAPDTDCWVVLTLTYAHSLLYLRWIKALSQFMPSQVYSCPCPPSCLVPILHISQSQVPASLPLENSNPIALCTQLNPNWQEGGAGYGNEVSTRQWVERRHHRGRGEGI